MVVIVLAGVVTLGILGFYVNSQATWIDASSQALAQRDATLLVEILSDRAREASSFMILPSSPDSSKQMVLLFDQNLVESSRFTWELGDSLVHLWQAGVDKGPVITSVVEEFKLGGDPSPSIFHLQQLQLRSTNGARIKMKSTFALYNAP